MLNRNPQHAVVFVFTLALSLSLSFAPAHAADFKSDFTNQHDRVWIGPQYWANPMEDWAIRDGRLECTQPGPNRDVHVLTHQLSEKHADFELRVKLGRADDGKAGGSAGFRIGIRGAIDDYRHAVFHGRGFDVGVMAGGRLFIGSPDNVPAGGNTFPAAGMELRLKAEAADDGTYALTLTGHDVESGEQRWRMRKLGVGADRLVGNIALVNNPDSAAQRAGNKARFWFRDLTITGDKVVEKKDQTFGPILFAMHTLHRTHGDDGAVMKLTAQMPPVGEKTGRAVRLQWRQKDGEWTKPREATIDSVARTARFRASNWDTTRDVAYRLTYPMKLRDGKTVTHTFEGTIRKEPIVRDLIVAGFTGNKDNTFPDHILTRNVGIQNPDVLVFTGDQIYEDVGGFGIIREPVDRAVLNYLRKWYMLGWAWRDLMKDRVTLCLPDDHDVYQGNIWGEAGAAMGKNGNVSTDGGYRQHADFVNAVQRTQTSHHPDPHDPTPVKQNIGVYYGPMLYGRVSFAIIEDRKFKTGPKAVADWPGRADHVAPGKLDDDWDPKSIDKPGVDLLGERQLKFLREWAADWRGADFKCVVSQTIFCNIANYHGGNQMYLIADLDSNGWPQTGRNKALDAMRRGFAFHLAGDQHLASIVHHGIETWGDAGYSFCVPSITAGYPRAWRPDEEGRPVRGRDKTGGRDNTGDYRDGLGNHVTVYAIGNPAAQNRRGPLLTAHDKASGHGIVRFNKKTGEITMQCWRLLFDANDPKPGDQFPGWPHTIKLTDNYGRAAMAWLPTIKVKGMTNPVVQVIAERDGEIVYTLRIRGDSFRPKVFAEGAYTVKVGEPGTEKMKTVKGLKAGDGEGREVAVDLTE